MDDVPLTHCKETSTNSPTLTTPIVEHHKTMTPRRQTNHHHHHHHQLHGHNNDLSSAPASNRATTNYKNKFYGGMSSSGCGTSSSINSVCGNTFTCDAMVGTRYIYRVQRFSAPSSYFFFVFVCDWWLIWWVDAILVVVLVAHWINAKHSARNQL